MQASTKIKMQNQKAPKQNKPEKARKPNYRAERQAKRGE